MKPHQQDQPPFATLAFLGPLTGGAGSALEVDVDEEADAVRGHDGGVDAVEELLVRRLLLRIVRVALEVP